MNLLIQPNQICLIVKFYNNRPELLPDSNGRKNENGLLFDRATASKYLLPFAYGNAVKTSSLLLTAGGNK